MRVRSSLSVQRAGLAPWHPIEVSVPLWPGFAYRDPVPKMGWYDPETKGWFSSGISDVNVDTDAQVLKFKTEHLGPVTLIQV